MPLTVNVNAGPPAVAEFGLRDVMTCAAAMVKVAAADVAPLSTTVTLALPAAATKLAGTCAVNFVALTKLVLSAVPFHCTTAPETKPVPLTVSVKAGPPAVAEFGLSDVIAGAAATVKVAVLDVTPFSTTVTVTVPGVAIRVAATWAVNCVALTMAVVSEVAFQWTTAPEINPEPFTVSAKEGPPVVAELGLIDVITGPEVTVKVTPADVTPFSATVTVAVPGVATKLAATCAANWVELTKVVVKAVLFHRTRALETKPVPFTVRVKAALPAVAALGLSEVIAGGGAIVNVALVDVTPPSTTVTVAVPAEAMKLAATWAVS